MLPSAPVKLPPPRAVLLAVLGIAAVWGIGDLVLRLFLFELNGAYNRDNWIYLGVGRGIVNGLVPYRDMFETKTPAIFLLSALSLWMTDGMVIAQVLQAVMLALLPVLIVIPVWMIVRKESEKTRTIKVLMALAGGLVLTLYTGIRGGPFQTEVYGAFFGCLYVAVVMDGRARMTWQRTMLASVGILGAAGFKEPFCITLLAAAIILSGSFRDFTRRFILPALIAAAAGLIVLAALGYLVPFVTAYLPFMTGIHVERYGYPLWLRAFSVHHLIRDAWTYSPFFFLLLALLWLHAFSDAFKAATKKQWIAIGATAASIAVFLFVAFFLYPGYRLELAISPAFRTVVAAIYPLARFAVMTAVPAILVWLSVRFATQALPPAKRRSARRRVWALLLALYLLIFGIGVGSDFFTHHFVFGVPVSVALIFLLLRTERFSGKSFGVPAVVFSILAALTVVAHARVDYGRELAWMREEYATTDRAAGFVDEVMNRCGIGRYLYVGDVGVHLYGLTKHSPLGPGFCQYSLNVTYPYFGEAFAANLQSVDLLVYPPPTATEARPLHKEVVSYIRDNFTVAMPPCAGELTQQPNFALFFRTEPLRYW